MSCLLLIIEHGTDRLQWSSELSNQLLVIVPDPDNSVHKDVSCLRAEIGRQADILRTHEGPPEMGQPVRPPFAHTHSYDAPPVPPVSPRAQAFDPSRRPSLQPASRTSSFRTPMPPHLTASPRRYGSTSGPSGPGGPNGSSSPSAVRPPPPGYTLPPPPAPPAQPQPQHPLATESSPPINLLRRHTSADIRLQGWQGQAPAPTATGPAHGGSPYASGQNSSQWPSSPYRQSANAEDQQLRNALAQYELPRANSYQINTRHVTPPPDQGPPSYANTTNEAGWQLPGPKFSFKGIEASAPPTRRSSMASNVHSLLNPPESIEREGDDDGHEERKRKRVA